ncbi:transcriptional regulator [Phyllobacterium sp. TAF24]|uniref:transcriptional regulator n=1 Tax=Phyllobacterium sp. TAF24 TaxID=3233068 RepID=UPI003F958105
MARVALGLGVRDLAALAQVSSDTIAPLERGEKLKPATLLIIRTALEQAGVLFEAEGEMVDGGPGVRLRQE